jgi:prepilin-type N-terminal cleavage/methylation domain-containing protein
MKYQHVPFGNHRAFTLVELLVVIAIIGVLASVVLARVSSARDKAQQGKTLASLKSAQTTAMYCVDERNNLSAPDIVNDICTGQGKWPAPVGLGWEYGTAGTCGFDGDVTDGNFLYCATNGTKTITCTEGGCTVVTN